MAPRPIIIDTDPGQDDAIAILLALASPELEVLGITAVAAVLSPPDPFSMIAMILPTILLYELSIWAVERVAKQRAASQTKT